ncbi:1,2-phenylacetyl-CoA epoxidase subunit PaaC [Allopusillimonas ginsengisoli]|uniref:1,2-phenylacetyl-CoA epoxidase subunit PaaC n=1 Tax=Allopusillimonas ginsengisoli TaxID=453575 RepID=UPI00102133DD|nr:1,2-phenylacetyl-CoA epoxidase subunit PaaC [Allopusillimonas ginsengisoli]TEA77381.1 phenylacetate-CoA oxygenase subunit PaaI [Allopusillimonas ginsengisoli]
MDHALFQYLLRLGDSTLVLSQRLSEWTGHGPALEEDLALTNTALDLLGQARMWLTLAGEVEGLSRDEDQLAYLRDAPDYRNYLLVERGNGDYGHTMLRQFFFDSWHYFLLQRLSLSPDARIADIAAKALKEVTYHARRSADIVVRLGDGTAESHQRMQSALDDLWRYTGELFVDDSIHTALAQRGVITLHETLEQDWLTHVQAVLKEATLNLPAIEDARHSAYQGGMAGRHTEALGYLLAEMQHLQRSYPGASW